MQPDGRIEQRNRLRAEPPPHDTVVVLRGGPDTAGKIARHAARTAQRWSLDGHPCYGISVFCALEPEGASSLPDLLAVRLGTYRLVHRASARKLIDAGFPLLPTASRPHFTIVMPGADLFGAARLLVLLGPARENPHHPSRGTSGKGNQ